MRRYTRFLSSILALSSFAATAHAHGGIPRALSIEFQPDDPQHVVVSGATVGVFVSRNGGQSWALSCYNAQGANPYDLKNNPPLALMTTGNVLSRASRDLMRSADDDLCSFEKVLAEAAGSGPLAVDVERVTDGSLLALISVASDDGSVTAQLWHSDASGASFASTGTVIGDSFAASSMAVSPANPDRAYVLGRVIEGDAANLTIARTEDGGEHWALQPVLGVASNEMPEQFTLLAMDPQNPELLFMRQASGAASGTIVGLSESIWFSPDGGATWKLLHSGNGQVSGFAYSPDGATVAIGDAGEGLYHVDVASLSLEGTPSKRRVFRGGVWGITWNARGLYAGLDEFAALDEPQFKTLGVSQDGGRTFAPLLSLCDVQAAACPADSAARSCYEDFVSDYLVNSGRCEAPGPDGGSGDNPPASGGLGGGTSAGGIPSAGGGSGGEAAAGSGGAQGASEDLRVTSCATSPSHQTSNHIASFMLTAMGAAFLLRRPVRRSSRAGSKRR